MKKLLFFIPVAFIILFSSCSGDNTYYEGSRIKTIYLTVNPRNWHSVVNQYSGYAIASYDVPEITPQIINSGVVICYLTGSYDVILPSMVTSDDGQGHIYYHTISFEVASGRINFISEYSDLIPTPPTDPLTFKISIIENINY